MQPEWKTKRVSPVRFKDSHASLFEPSESKYNTLRASKLRLEDRRDKPYNIITNEVQEIV
jgi:hypothetical protein